MDFAQLMKIHGVGDKSATQPAEVCYSPAQCMGARKVVITGHPDFAHVSTSHTKRQNLSMRMSMRRFTRLTNVFSNKLANHEHARALTSSFAPIVIPFRINFKIVFASLAPSCGNQFSAECSPPVPARKTMFIWSGSPGTAVAQFHWHAPQWTHFSRSNDGTPAAPGVMAWPLHASMQIRVPHTAHSSGYRNTTWSAYPGGACTLPPISSAS
jgi:hypothetical protein